MSLARLHHAVLLADSLGSRVNGLGLKCRRGLKTGSRIYQEAQAKDAEISIPGTPYKNLTIGVAKEIFTNERRVALIPATVATLTKKGFSVNIEENAGVEAKFLNEDYAAAGANLVNRDKAFTSDIVLKVRAPETKEIEFFKQNGTLLSFLYPAQNKELVDLLAKRNMTVFAMDCVPRISRAQVFDALSSMANIAGYKAVIEAANNFGRFFTGKFCSFFCPQLSRKSDISSPFKGYK